MSKEKSPQVVTLDGVEFDANTFTEQQTLMLQHCIDLDRKINSTQFQPVSYTHLTLPTIYSV